VHRHGFHDTASAGYVSHAGFLQDPFRHRPNEFVGDHRQAGSQMTYRICFSLEMPGENVAEYRRRHDDLWPALGEAIRAQGGHNYSIFALPDVDRVVGYLEVDDIDVWNSASTSEITQAWWNYMADIMPTNADNSPIQAPAFEVFHLD
jgi:L-rhamnose mutarotase